MTRAIAYTRTVFTVAATVWLGACNEVYGLAPTALVDAPPAPDDTDLDTVIDGADNCLGTANTDQRDIDEDGVGDVCDNCPLVANPSQRAVGDGDAIGDDCDPRPVDGNDCVVLIDTFARPDGDVIAAWDVVGDGARITTSIDGLHVQPGPGPVTLLARAPISAGRRYDVTVFADITVTTGGLWALSNIATPDTGSACGVVYDSINLGTIGAETTSRGNQTAFGSIGDLYPEPGGSITMIRMTQPRVVPGSLACRVEHGYALGLSGTQIGDTTVPAGGAPGLRVAVDAATIHGIAVYLAGGGTCPAPIIR